MKRLNPSPSAIKSEYPIIGACDTAAGRTMDEPAHGRDTDDDAKSVPARRDGAIPRIGTAMLERDINVHGESKSR